MCVKPLSRFGDPAETFKKEIFMKLKSNVKQWLALLLCAVMITGVTVQGAMASAATDRCTNIVNEGIEYQIPVGLDANADDWRQVLDVVLGDGTKGDIIGMEVEVANLDTRYQCTQVIPSLYDQYSCNSMPKNSKINAVYVMYRPSGTVTADEGIIIEIQNAATGGVLLRDSICVRFPPIPCSRNYLLRDFVADTDEGLVINTSDCDDNGIPGPNDPSLTEEHQTLTFWEQSEHFAIVNISQLGISDQIDPNRLMISVTPKETYSYTLTLYFASVDELVKGVPDPSWDVTAFPYWVEYIYSEADPNNPVINYSSDWVGDPIIQSKLPLVLVGGTMTDISTTRITPGGDPDYPTRTEFEIKFWYENNTGTLGYENSLFHFTRNMTVQFAPYCTGSVTSGVLTGIATALYDPCQSTRQLFTVNLQYEDGTGIVVPDNMAGCTALPYCNDLYSVYVADAAIEPVPAKNTNYYFATRKCADSACNYYTTTTAYLYSLTMADGDNLAITYKGKHYASGSTTTFAMKAYENTASSHPFAVKGARIMVEEPGTYVVYGFLEESDIKNNDLSHYAVKFYITVNKMDDIKTCSTLANNGYFIGYWNDCLSYKETQLIPFEHIPGTQEAWIENRSARGVHFPYVAAYSYLPQKLEVVSLNCSFTPLEGGSNPGAGYCLPDDVYVPAYTKVTINSGTFYMPSIPEEDEYRVAYMREDTMNISHLIFTIPVKPCETVKKIPDTGISLRSPLKVKEKVDEATSYVFTGNSLRIPAIGLGMEVPIPIVHVYYEEGSTDLGWDLSTLGNYVGELEGGSYLPYPGNSALTGHYYSMGVFKNLEYLNLGDEIIVFGNDGIKYTYKVAQKFLVQPEDVYEMFQQIAERSLTLVTCENYNLVTDEYERRQLIRATIDTMEPYEKTW